MDSLPDRGRGPAWPANVRTGAIPQAIPDHPPALPGVVAQKPPNARLIPEVRGAVDLVSALTAWTELGNSIAGDCVIAAAGHIMQVARKLAYGDEIVISEDEALAAYEKITGWSRAAPGDGGPGMTISTGFDYVRDHGLGGHQLAAHYRSTWPPRHGQMSRGYIKSLIAFFGGVGIGFALPEVAARSPGPWRAANMTAAMRGFHCVPLVAADDDWVDCISWGRIVRMDWSFLEQFTSEVHVSVANSWVGPRGSPFYGMRGVELTDTMNCYAVSEFMRVVPWPDH